MNRPQTVKKDIVEKIMTVVYRIEYGMKIGDKTNQTQMTCSKQCTDQTVQM